MITGLLAVPLLVGAPAPDHRPDVRWAGSTHRLEELVGELSVAEAAVLRASSSAACWVMQ